METSLSCPQCNQPLAAEAPQGLCAACLLRAGLATATAGEAGGSKATFVPPTPAELAPLFPQLEIIGLVGQGGMGAVYRARQPNLDRVVALKILPPQAGRDPGFAERFMREARALGRLSHPNIVAVHDFGVAAEYHYFLMEFVDGVTLRQLLTTRKTVPREALAIVPQICDALQFAHDQGIVHRDIKPENILIAKTGTVKIADFGLAKIVGAEVTDVSLTGEHDVMGTPHYMAPEQVERPLEVDHRADIYSLGVVFYQMLTGELPIGRFAAPSRRVQVDVRLDEVVLRALEKEPELRYQQASGLKSEVETIASSARAGARAGRADGDRSVSGSGRPRWQWAVLCAVWLLAAAALGLQADAVRDYLQTVGRLGVKDGAELETPLRQIYPGFASDAQTWVRHALELAEGDALRLRHTRLDNAPEGRAVQWSSGWAWCVAGAGKVHQFFTGLPLPLAVERATLWLNPVAMLALIVALSWWATRRLGLLSGVILAGALACHDRIYEGFFPSYVDHHGLAAMAVVGVALGAVVMGGGWRQRPDGRAVLLPRSTQAVERGAIFSALCGALGLWVSAASTVPAIALVSVAGVLAIALQGRRAGRDGAEFEARAWRLWGRVGGGASAVFYLLEYFPSHLGLRLDGNSPLHALAWVGAGELIAQFGTRWLGPAERRWSEPRALLALSVAPVALFVGGARVFPPVDPFLALLHRDHVHETFPLWQMLRDLDFRALFEAAQTGSLAVLAAGVTLAFRRRENSIVLWLATLVTAGFTVMAWWQARWLLNAVAASVVLLVVLLACWTATLRGPVRWAIGLVILAQFFVPQAVQRYAGMAADVRASRVAPADAQNALHRDIARALRRTQPRGEIVLLASPNASTRIGYYGRFRTLGTLYWENGDGLKAAARIFSANEAEAAGRLRERRVTHIAIVDRENFIAQYHRLLHPAATDADVRRSFGGALLRGEGLPAWVEPIPYVVPADLAPLKTRVALFKVRLD